MVYVAEWLWPAGREECGTKTLLAALEEIVMKVLKVVKGDNGKRESYG